MAKASDSPAPLNYLNELIDRLRPMEAFTSRADQIDSALGSLHDSDGPTAIKRWFSSHNGDRVTTFQIDGLRDSFNVWSPGDRVVEAKSTYVLLDGSRADYAGKVIASNADTLILWDGWHLRAYTA